MQPGTDQDQIVDMVCVKILKREGSSFLNEDFMKSVIELYRMRTGQVPIIVIEASQRSLNKSPAYLTSAARKLVDNFGLNVLIDCSENELPNEMKTGREVMIRLEPITDDMMRQLPEFKELDDLLNKKDNLDVLLAICGGVPLLLTKPKHYIKLK